MVPTDGGQLTRHVLDNGLTVLLLADHRLPIAATCVWYHAGARDEPPGRTGLAHLLEHMMFQGTQHLGPNEYTTYVQSAGGAANGDTTLESTYFVSSFPAHHLEPVLWMEADRMRNVGLAMSAERLQTQRSVVLNERFQRYDNKPLELAWERLMELAHPEGHPFRHLPAGRQADLLAIRLRDVREFFFRHYHPGNAILTVVGDLDPAGTLGWIERYFGGIPAAPAGHRRLAAPSATRAHSVTCLEVPVRQSGVMHAYRLPPIVVARAESDVLPLAVAAIGGARDGRLRAMLGPDGTAADIRCRLLQNAWSPSIAVFDVRCPRGRSPEQVDSDLRSVLHEFAARGPTAAELARCAARQRRTRLERLSTVEGRAPELARGMALHADPWHGFTAADDVSPEEVRRAAAGYLTDAARPAVLLYAGTMSADGADPAGRVA
jgi:predicted Zn-dependent peptidase